MLKFRFRFSRPIIFLCTGLLLTALALLYFFLNGPHFPSTLFSRPTNLPYQDSTRTIETRVNDLLSRMTIAEKIGQMALVEKNSIHNPNDIAKYGLGALLSGAGAKPTTNTPKGWFHMVRTFQKITQKTRLNIPLLYGVDANHGHGNVPGATIFPHAIGLGASKDPDLVRAVARATAEEVAATGINWVYSPDIDVVQDTRWGRTYETFGSDPDTVGALGSAYIDGLQSFEKDGLKIAASAKHFVGNGASVWGSSTNKDFYIDQGSAEISDQMLRRVHLKPFQQAVEANVHSIMVGLNSLNGKKVAFNTYLITDVLKKEFGFKGFVVSDWYGVYENESDISSALIRAVNAGVDMIMLPFDYKTFSDKMQQAVANGDIDQSRLDDAVRRILAVKFELGLFDGAVMDYPETISTEQHRELARRAVRESLVLLKGASVVPIPENVPKIFVAGSAANNIGIQSGAWTVEWQGIDGNWIPGTTVLKGIQDRASSSTRVEFDTRADFTNSSGLADIGIAVVGEHPYAEGWGDAEDPKLSEDDLEIITKLKKQSKKIVVIIISGRPLDIKMYEKDWDAVIAAWLPGAEGQGVADVLFGDYPFVGSLPVDWDM